MPLKPSIITGLRRASLASSINLYPKILFLFSCSLSEIGSAVVTRSSSTFFPSCISGLEIALHYFLPSEKYKGSWGIFCD